MIKEMFFRKVSLGFLLLVFSLALWKLQLNLSGSEAELIKVKEIANQDGRFNPAETLAVFNNQLIPSLRRELAFKQSQRVLSAVTPDLKWIEVDLTNQILKAHEGERVVYEFPVSTGKWGRTPTGDFEIWIKLRYTLMHGGSKELGTYYYLPNVPYTMYFNGPYGLHGTYWHNNFGHPMSHGCVNMRTPDAEKIFYWSDPAVSANENTVRPTKENPGTRVIVHGVAPLE